MQPNLIITDVTLYTETKVIVALQWGDEVGGDGCGDTGYSSGRGWLELTLMMTSNSLLAGSWKQEYFF